MVANERNLRLVLGSGGAGVGGLSVEDGGGDQSTVGVLRKSHMDEDEKRMFWQNISVASLSKEVKVSEKKVRD